jgi:tetratricopeptide (TPR) repeat protein
VACSTNYVKKGDSAAALGEWKSAVFAYEKAIKQDPSVPGLSQKYERAKKNAIKQSFAIAKRCKSDGDPECIEKEAGFILRIDPANEQAAEMKRFAEREASQQLLDKASRYATNREYIKAVLTLKKAKEKSNDSDIDSQIDAKVVEIAEPTAAKIASLMSVEDTGTPKIRFNKYSCFVEALKIVLRHTDGHDELLPQAKKRRDEALFQLEEIRRKKLAAKKRAEEKRRKEREKRSANRNRTVTLTGLLVGPAKANSKPWDGFGKVGGKKIAKLAAALSGVEPYTAALGLISGPVFSSIEAPDVAGRAELYRNGRLVHRYKLRKRQDTYTPSWSGIVWKGVNVYESSIRLTLVDRDFDNDDDIGILEITSDQLQEAAEEGKVFPVKVNDQTNNQVLFALILVKAGAIFDSF